MPHPPQPPDPSPGVVAIQLSRLNEALLVAYSVMAPTNLKAVDQVVKIVRELNRYGGAFAAEWARPEASRAEPGNRSLASARARRSPPQNPLRNILQGLNARTPIAEKTLGATRIWGPGQGSPRKSRATS